MIWVKGYKVKYVITREKRGFIIRVGLECLKFIVIWLVLEEGEIYIS